MENFNFVIAHFIFEVGIYNIYLLPINICIIIEIKNVMFKNKTTQIKINED